VLRKARSAVGPGYLAPTPVSKRVDVRRPVVKIIAESLSQHDEKPVVPSPLSVGKG
jgi:hypothetical protein